jgi:hypothetical protein
MNWTPAFAGVTDLIRPSLAIRLGGKAAKSLVIPEGEGDQETLRVV